jgi:ABC-type multidrug transport system fused ATPase/permease subunit
LGSLVALIYFLLDENKFIEIFGENFFQINFFNIGNISIILLVVVLIFIIKNIFLIYYYYFETKLRYYILADKSKNIYKSYFNSNYTYFKTLSRSLIFNNIMIESGRVIQYIFGFVRIIREVFMAFSLFFAIFFLDKFYSSIIFITLLVVSFILYFLFSKKFLNIGKALKIVTENLLSVINETQNLFKMIILRQKKSFFFEKFDKNINSRTKNFIKQELVKQIPKYLFETILVILICSILFLASNSSGGVKELIPFLSVLILISIRLLPTFINLNSILSSLKFSSHSFYNHLSTLENLKKNHGLIDSDMKQIDIDDLKSISINNLNFSYGKNILINNLNLEIQKGKIFGIFGKSGSGKSTLVDIITGLIQPKSGKILINNEYEIFQILKTWQSVIGYVPQENLLMNDTLKNNICLGLDDKEINKNKLEDVLKIVGLDDLVVNSMDGLNTNMGELGTKFSGGQKQRIAIARALYFNPKLLIFDEATSALDNKSEDQIIKIINNIKKDKIVILITHDLRLKIICDQIYEMN